MTTSRVLGPSRTALVTGASRGIGPVIARRLAAEGNHMILTGRSDSDLRTVADELRAAGGTASVLTADLTSTDAAAALVDAVEREHGRIDLLVNNAGGDPLREFHTMTVAENLQILELNLIAPLALTRAALPGMLERQRGHIVNISAMAGRVSFPFTEAYAAAKDGLIGFTRVLRSDYRARGVSASVLILGAIRDAGQGQRMLDEAGLRSSRFMAPANDVAEAAVRAVRKDHAEVVVMPGPGRLVRALMDYFPGLGPAMNDRLGSRRSLEQVIELRASHHDEGGERDIVDSSATAPAGDSDRCAS